MYTDFYNLKEKPFNLTPSPLFLYLGESHKEALALLTYGIEERKGFILLTGEIGTGKTTIVQALLANRDESVEYIHIANPLLSSKEFLEYITFSAFKKKVPFESRATFLFEFEAFLKDCIQHQKSFVLIIDEAQTLSFELLEELRLLSNMESANEKCINIILVGQPELNEKLRDPICKALLQRISHRFHILPFNLEDTRRYIERRLNVAGIKDANEIFSKGAIKAIYGYSQGYPRVINILADNCLLLGYSKGKKKITSSIVQKSHEDMELDVSISKVTQETLRPTEKGKKTFRMKKNTGLYWKWALALILIVIGVVFGMSQKARNLLRQLSDVTTVVQDTPPVDRITPRKTSMKVSKSKKEQVGEGTPVSPDPFPLDTVTSLMDQGRLKTSDNDNVSKNTKKSTKVRYYEVQAGDTLAKIGIKYGVTVDELQRLNKLVPGAIIYIGQKIIISQPDKTELDSTISFPRSTSRDTNSPSLVDQSKREPDASPESVLGDEVNLLTNQSTKGPASTPLSSKSLQKTIYEISIANGNFDSAQEIMEGVIIGKRGTVRDRADYYKIQATGNIMTLKLKPSLKDKNHRFIITVFDVNQRLIGGGNSEDTSQTITLAVTPQATYYIKLDLNRAPIETPQYQLSFRFK